MTVDVCWRPPIQTQEFGELIGDRHIDGRSERRCESPPAPDAPGEMSNEPPLAVLDIGIDVARVEDLRKIEVQPHRDIVIPRKRGGPC